MAKRGSKANRIKMSKEEWIYQICIALLVGLVVVACLVPLLYVIGMSFTSEGEMMEKNYFVIFPEKPIVSAYTHLLSDKNFFNGLKITIIRTLLGVCTALILSVPVGYIMAHSDLPFGTPIMIFFIITMILSGGLIPNYLLMSRLKLTNSFWVYIAPSFANTYAILVVKLFVEGIPKDLMECADLDGAGEMQKMWYVALPLLKPTICALGMFAAVTHWNAWFDAMVYVRDEKLWPVQYIIRNLLNKAQTTDLMANISTFAKTTDKSLKMASVVLAILPIICVYPFLQKYFVKGVFTGSVKG